MQLYFTGSLLQISVSEGHFRCQWSAYVGCSLRFDDRLLLLLLLFAVLIYKPVAGRHVAVGGLISPDGWGEHLAFEVHTVDVGGVTFYRGVLDALGMRSRGLAVSTGE